MTERGDADNLAQVNAAVKKYRVPPSEPEAFMVELAQWERLERRVNALEKAKPIDWLFTVAASCATLAASAVIAVLSLPTPTSTNGIGKSVQPVLLVLAGAAAVVALICVGLFRQFRGQRTNNATDICDEMKTIRNAWKQREGD
jgi:hypothetical protein